MVPADPGRQYDLLAYFLPLPSKGPSDNERGNAKLRRIALAGTDWTDRIGNPTVAGLYMYRLALGASWRGPDRDAAGADGGFVWQNEHAS